MVGYMPVVSLSLLMILLTSRRGRDFAAKNGVFCDFRYASIFFIFAIFLLTTTRKRVSSILPLAGGKRHLRRRRRV
jgi:hypothetical protein